MQKLSYPLNFIFGLFIAGVLTSPFANAKSLGVFSADEIFITQIPSPPSINVIHLTRVNGILHTTVLSRQLAFKGDFQTKFDLLDEVLSSAKANDGRIEVIQQHKRYFWLKGHPTNTPKRVSHKIAPLILDYKPGEDSYHLAHLHYYLRSFAQPAWDEERSLQLRLND